MEKFTIPVSFSSEVVTAIRTALGGKVPKAAEDFIADVTEFVVALVQSIADAYNSGLVKLEKVDYTYTKDGKTFTTPEYRISITCNITTEPIKFKIAFKIKAAYDATSGYSHFRLSLG